MFLLATSLIHCDSRLPLLGRQWLLYEKPLDQLVYPELDADHGHHGHQSRRQSLVQRSHTLGVEDLDEAVHHAGVVLLGPGPLSHDPRLHGVHGDHHAACPSGSQRPDERIL